MIEAGEVDRKRAFQPQHKKCFRLQARVDRGGKRLRAAWRHWCLWPISPCGLFNKGCSREQKSNRPEKSTSSRLWVAAMQM